MIVLIILSDINTLCTNSKIGSNLKRKNPTPLSDDTFDLNFDDNETDNNGNSSFDSNFIPDIRSVLDI